MGSHTVDPRKVKGTGTKSRKIVATNPSPNSKKDELICSAKYQALTLDFSKGITLAKYNKNTPEVVAKRLAKYNKNTPEIVAKGKVNMRGNDKEMLH